MISLVLPVCLKEFGKLSYYKRAGKHEESDKSSLLVLFLSLGKFIKFKEEVEMLLVCPEAEMEAIKRYVNSLHRRFCDAGLIRMRFVSDEYLIGFKESIKRFDPGGLGGWYFQQLIKICCSNIVDTEYYITLDSDIFLTKNTRYNDLFTFGKSYVNVETEKVYHSIYTAEFAKYETHIKRERLSVALNILKLAPKDDSGCKFYGETPVVLSRSVSQALILHLNGLCQNDWIQHLMQREGWTEYALYFGFANAVGMFGDYHVEAHENKILDVSRSVWHPNSCYKLNRDYGFSHFFLDQKPDEGFFVAIQSWINQSCWLPKGYASRSDFYGDVISWLG